MILPAASPRPCKAKGKFIMRSVIASFKILGYVLLTFTLIAVQKPMLWFARDRAISLAYPKIYWKMCCAVFGVKIRVEGNIAKGEHLIYAGNHISYMDIPVMGSLLNASFIAKKEIEGWPVFGWLGTLGQTVYISRAPLDAPKEAQALNDRLSKPLPIIMFPEGTSTNGRTVIPFKSSLFQIFLNKNLRIQPFTISLVEIDGRKPETDDLRDLYAWHGDMTLVPHLWAFAKTKGAVIKVVFQDIVSTRSYDDRKKLSNDCYEGVVRGLDLSCARA
jgi:lyso-ornithine lipid O-acyltransferase